MSLTTTSAASPREGSPSDGAIAGAVTAAGGGSLSGVCVYAVAVGPGGGYGSATTDASGAYTISGLPAGSYTVEFNPCAESTYGFQYYNGQTDYHSANAVTVTSGTTTSGVDAALVLGGSITGTVTSAPGGADLSGVCVEVSGPQTLYSSVVTTDANGRYTVSELPAGAYTVDFDPTCAGSATTVYGPQSYSNEVAVESGSTASGINAALALGGSITGTVTAASGGADQSGVCVEVAGIRTGFDRSATTAANGTYSISGLAADSYIVEFDPTCYGETTSTYAPQYYRAASYAHADDVAVTSGGTTSGIDAALERDGSMTGTVTAANGGALDGVCVLAFGEETGSMGSATTSPSGAYTISDLPADSYTVEFDPTCAGTVTSSYLVQYYDDQAQFLSANPAVVTSSQTTTSVDAALVTPPPSIAGISPSSGPGTGGTDVTITGTGFTEATKVLFGTVPATSYTVESPTRITAVAPVEAPGLRNVSITTPDGTSATVTADQFTDLAPPAVTGVSPSSGPIGGGTDVTINGTAFTGATKVLFGLVPATSYTVESPTRITAVAPAEAAALHNVFVTTPGGTSAPVTADEFTYLAPPVVTGVSPSTGPTTGGTTVTITGTGFSWVTKVLFGLVPATSFTVESPTRITAVAPAEAAALHNVFVTTAGGTSVPVTADQFSYT